VIDKLIEQQETIKGMQENEESAIKIMKMYEDYKLKIENIKKYIKTFNLLEIDTEILCILNDICLILENSSELVVRLKGEDKE
jgi:DNA-binding ferritin-like protein (Dps family)